MSLRLYRCECGERRVIYFPPVPAENEPVPGPVVIHDACRVCGGFRATFLGWRIFVEITCR